MPGAADKSAAPSEIAARYRPFEEPLLSDPYPFFGEARENEPVFYSEEIDHWLVLRYDDIREVFSDDENYSARNTLTPISEPDERARAVLEAGEWGLTPALGNADEPAHSANRKIVFKLFTERLRETAVAEHTEKFVTGALEGIEREGGAELMERFVRDLPAYVILKLLGLSADNLDILKKAAAHRIEFVWGRPGVEEQVSVAEGMVEVLGFCRRVVREKLESPGDDVVSELVRSRDGDDSVMTLELIASILFAFLTAGHETTSSMLGNAIRQLLSHREAWEAIREQPKLIRKAIDEVLRYDSSVIAWRRLTVRPVTIRGVEIPADRQVLLVLGSANRDPRVFDEPDRFDIRRKNAGRHLSFGFGAHFCLGAQLARQEAATAIRCLTERLPDLSLAPSQSTSVVPNIAFRGPRELRVLVD